MHFGNFQVIIGNKFKETFRKHVFDPENYDALQKFMFSDGLTDKICFAFVSAFAADLNNIDNIESDNFRIKENHSETDFATVLKLLKKILSQVKKFCKLTEMTVGFSCSWKVTGKTFELLPIVWSMIKI